MKKMFAAVVALMFVASMAVTALASEEMTIKGEAMCTKCSMKETTKCGCAIKTADGTVYYAKNNDVTKEFHETICHGPSKVTATGKVSEKDGKKSITLTKIEVDKDAK